MKKKEQKNDLLWVLPRDSWRLAAGLGTTALVLIAVIMHIYGWITDDTETMMKGLEGVGYAVGYFLMVCFLKFVYEGINVKKEDISLKDIIDEVEIKKR